MARSPLFDLYDPHGILERQARDGVLPGGARRLTVSDLLPEEEKKTMLRQLAQAGSSGLGTLGYLLDYPGSFVRGVLAGKPLSFLGATDDRVSGRDLLRQYGLLGKKDTYGNFAVGLLGEILLDPLSYVNPLAILGKGALSATGKTLARAGLLENVGVAARNAGVGRRELLRRTGAEIIGSDASAMERFRNAAKGRGYDPDSLLGKPAASLMQAKLPFTDSGVPLDFGPLGGWLARKADAAGEILATNRFTAPVVNRLTASFDPTVMGAVDRNSQWRNREAFARGRQAERDALERIQQRTRAAETASAPPGFKSFYDPRIQNAIVDTIEAGLDPGRVARLVDQDAVRALESVPEWRKWRDAAAAELNDATAQADQLGLSLPTWRGTEGTGFFPSQSIYFNTEKLDPRQLERLRGRPNPYERGARVLSLDDLVGRARQPKTDIPQRSQTFRLLMTDDAANSLRGRSLQDKLLAADDTAAAGIIDQAFDAIGVARPYQNLKATYEGAQTTLGDLLAMRGSLAAYAAAAPRGSAAQQVRELNKVIAPLQRQADALKVELADMLRLADRQFAERGVGLFDRSAVDNLVRYARGRARSFANRDVALDDLARNTIGGSASNVPGGGYKPFLEAAESVGFNRASLKRLIANNTDPVLQRLKTSLGDDPAQWAVSEKAVEPLLRLMNVAPSQSTMAGRALSDYTSLWKLGALFSPAYHFRNAYSGFFANLIGGADNAFSLGRDAYAGRQAALGNYKPLYSRIRNSPGYSGLTEQQAVDKFLAESARNKLGQGQVLDDLGLEAGAYGPETRNMSLGQDTPNPIRWYTPGRTWRDWLGDMTTIRGTGSSLRPNQTAASMSRNPLVQLHERVGRRVEEANRLGMYINEIRRGSSPDYAAGRVARTQVDYSPQAFAEFERGLKRWAPFYSYTRGIFPLIGENILYRPGGLQGQTIRAVAAAARPNEEFFTPEHLRKSAAIPLPYRPAENLQRYLTSVELPFSVVNLFSPGRGGGPIRSVLDSAGRTGMNLLGQLHPLPKSLLENAFDRQLYSGRDLSELYSVLEQDLGPLGRTAEQAIMSLVPYGSKAVPIYRTLRDSRLTLADRLLKTGINQTLGFGLTDVDQARTKQSAAREALKEILQSTPGVRTYENLAVPDEALAKLTPQQQRLYLLYRVIQADAARQARERERAAAAGNGQFSTVSGMGGTGRLSSASRTGSM
jgi:hypothetical protein